jgi:hypothetical protein
MLGFCLHSVKYRTLGYWRIFRRSGDKLADLSHRRRRLHQAVGYRTAMAVWRQGATPAAYGHVDKACALTTCPWPDQNQQQTEPLAT